MDENPYQSPTVPTETAIRFHDQLRLPAMGCVASAVLAIILAVCQFVFSVRFLRLAEEAENYRAAKEASEMAVGSYWLAGLSLLAILAAICIFTRRFRWLVILSGIVGVATCLPAPLAIIVLMRLWKKDVWNSFK